MNIIEHILEIGISFKYFILLSWVDYPIKSNNFIFNFLKNTNKNFMEFSQIQPSYNYFDYFQNKQLWFKISKWHFYDTLWYNWNSKNNSIKHWWYRFFILLNILFLNLFLRSKKIDRNITYYFWSSWWCLSYESIKYIFDFYKENDNFNTIFQYSDASDEMYFHTVILNSPYKDFCINNNLRYIDWDKNREWPAILVKEDFEKITRSSALFARKFSPKSKELLDLLNKKRENEII